MLENCANVWKKDTVKKLPRSGLTPGMIVGEDIFSYSNQLIVPKGSVLTDKVITRLEFYAIPYIKIEDTRQEEAGSDTTADIPRTAIDASTENMAYSDQIRSSPQFIRYKTDFDKTIGDFKDNINDIVQKGAKIDTNELLTQATHLISGTSNTSDFFNIKPPLKNYKNFR